MTDFSQARAGGPQGSAVAPQRAVQEPSVIAGVAQMGQQLIGLKQTVDNRKAQLNVQQQALDAKAQEGAVDSLVGSYVMELDKIASAVRQGKLTKAEADTRRSRKRNEYIAANNGRYSKELLAAGKAFEGVSDGNVLTTGGEEEIQLREEKDRARKDGFLFSYMNEEQEDAAMEGWRSIQMKNAAMEQSTKEMNYSKLQREEKQEILVADSKQHLRSVAPEYAEQTANFGKEIMARFEAGVPAKDLILEIKARRQTITTSMGYKGVDAPDAFIDSLVSPIVDHLDFLETQLTGEFDSDLISKQEALLNARTLRSIYLLDPSLRVMAQFSNINKNFDVTSFSSFTSKANKVLATMAGTTPEFNPFEDGDDAAPLSVVLKDGKELLRQASSVTANEAQVEVGRTFLDNFMKQMGKSQSSAETPKDMVKALDFIADPQFADAVAKLGYSPESMAIAKDVYDRQYADVVYPKIFTQWTQPSDTVDTYLTPTGASKKMPPPSEYLEAVESGGVIRFRVKEGYGTELKMNRAKGVKEETGGVLGIPRTLLEQKAKQANQDVAKLVNKLVKYEAHLQGRKDYSAVFREQLAGELGMGEKEAEEAVEAPLSPPEVGEVRDGYTFIGSDASVKSNWSLSDAN